jgi:hypothetical protein
MSDFSWLPKKERFSLFDIVANPTKSPFDFGRSGSDNKLRALFDPGPAPTSNPFDALWSPSPLAPRTPATRLGSILAPVVVPDVRRKVYFAFSFADVIRVNNVRHTGKIGPRETKNARTFYDRSIWERRSIMKDEGLKNLMRNAVKYSSAVCVLIGTETWASRWVKYEIARAVIDGRGLFGVHINNINHNLRRKPDPHGYSPLHLMGVYRDPNGKFYLWEQNVTISASGELKLQWEPYEDFTDPVSLPRYTSNISVGYVMPLSRITREYDFMVDVGSKNIGKWIDDAADAAGR